MIAQEGKRMSQRAMKGPNVGELWLIDETLKDAEVIEMSETARFVRHRGGVYSFGSNLWTRMDGDPCPEEPGMIYVVGEVQQVLPR